MKAIMITFDQAHYKSIERDMLRFNIRGFTAWKEVVGRGSNTGIPHYGSHAWPSKNNAIFVVVEESQLDGFLHYLKELNTDYENLGLRAFVWDVESAI